MIETGKEMWWHQTVSNWGHKVLTRVRVRKIGKHVTVDALDADGNVTRSTVVRPEHLHEIGEED